MTTLAKIYRRDASRRQVCSFLESHLVSHYSHLVVVRTAFPRLRPLIIYFGRRRAIFFSPHNIAPPCIYTESYSFFSFFSQLISACASNTNYHEPSILTTENNNKQWSRCVTKAIQKMARKVEFLLIKDDFYFSVSMNRPVYASTLILKNLVISCTHMTTLTIFDTMICQSWYKLKFY